MPDASSTVNDLETPTINDCSEWISPLDAVVQAKRKIKPTSFAYFTTGAGDEATLRANDEAYLDWWFKPRVLRNVSQVSLVPKPLFGKMHALPLFVCPTALGKLANPRGEISHAEACARKGIPFMVPHLGSCSWSEVQAAAGAEAASKNMLQLYLPRDKPTLNSILEEARLLNFAAVAVTVDAAAVGKRDRDLRARRLAEGAQATPTSLVATAPRASSMRWDDSFSWETLRDFQIRAALPVILKGVTRGDDAVRAAEMGVSVIYVSNHGGRNLDRCRPSLHSLVEIHRALTAAGVRNRVTLLFDGGVSRGVDVITALCLGADFVGLGRLALWGMAAQGAEGVYKIVDMIEQEMLDTMKILGCSDVKELKPEGDWLEPATRARI